MVYKIEYKESVEKDLKEIDRSQQRRILDVIERDLASFPKDKSEPLKGQWKGLWRYKLKTYRVIFAVDDAEKTVLIIKIGHRKDVYR